MKKEVLFAIFLGLIVGLLISFGAYTANKALKKAKTNKLNSKTTPLSSSSPLSKDNSNLVIKEPENNLVIRENEATVSGQAEPGATIAILAEDQEELLLADEQGFFSTIINLISGVNEIKITAINKDGQKEEKKILVVHSTANIK